jgi:hypothetical protein
VHDDLLKVLQLEHYLSSVASVGSGGGGRAKSSGGSGGGAGSGGGVKEEATASQCGDQTPLLEVRSLALDDALVHCKRVLEEKHDSDDNNDDSDDGDGEKSETSGKHQSVVDDQDELRSSPLGRRLIPESPHCQLKFPDEKPSFFLKWHGLVEKSIPEDQSRLPIIVGCVPSRALAQAQEEAESAREEAELARLLAIWKKKKKKKLSSSATAPLDIDTDSSNNDDEDEDEDNRNTKKSCLEDFARLYDEETAQIEESTRPLDDDDDCGGGGADDSKCGAGNPTAILPSVFVSDPPLTYDAPIEAASKWVALSTPLFGDDSHVKKKGNTGNDNNQSTEASYTTTTTALPTSREPITVVAESNNLPRVLSCCFPGVGTNGHFGVAFKLNNLHDALMACGNGDENRDEDDDDENHGDVNEEDHDNDENRDVDENHNGGGCFENDSSSILSWLSVLPTLLDSLGAGGRRNDELASSARTKTLYCCLHVETNFRTGRGELVVRGAGMDAEEVGTALELLADKLTKPHWGFPPSVIGSGAKDTSGDGGNIDGTSSGGFQSNPANNGRGTHCRESDDKKNDDDGIGDEAFQLSEVC